MVRKGRKYPASLRKMIAEARAGGRRPADVRRSLAAGTLDGFAPLEMPDSSWWALWREAGTRLVPKRVEPPRSLDEIVEKMVRVRHLYDRGKTLEQIEAETGFDLRFVSGSLAFTRRD